MTHLRGLWPRIVNSLSISMVNCIHFQIAALAISIDGCDFALISAKWL